MKILLPVVEAHRVSGYCIEMLFNTGLRKTVFEPVR